MAKRLLDRNLAIVLIVAGTIFIAAVLIVRRWQQSMQAQQEPAVITSITQ